VLGEGLHHNYSQKAVKIENDSLIKLFALTCETYPQVTELCC
jgi:hypothetical protein